MNSSGIYKIQSIIRPERCYIGSAVNINNRWKHHISELKLNKHGNKKLQNHTNKYGIDDLQFYIAENCDKDKLIQREQFFIDELNPYFNICKIAGSALGIRRSIETCKKISKKAMGHQRNLGRKLSPQAIEKLVEFNRNRIKTDLERQHRSDGHKNIRPSSTTRIKMRIKKIGNKNRLGVKDTEETKEKKRISAKRAWIKRKLGKNE
jgi:group I intron endonuclease